MGLSPPRGDLVDEFEVDPQLCTVTLFANGEASAAGGTPPGEEEIIQSARGVTPHPQPHLNPPREVRKYWLLGDRALCEVVLDGKFPAPSPGRPDHPPIWTQELRGYRPLLFREWLDARRTTHPRPRSIFALVLIKMRDDALLQDVHLLPVAVAEHIVELAHKLTAGRIDVDPWLTVGPADLMLLVSADRVSDLGRLLDGIREISLGVLFPPRAPSPHFQRALWDNFKLVPSEILERQWARFPKDASDVAPSADAFVRTLRITTLSRTVTGVPLEALDAVGLACDELVFGDKPPSDPLAWLRWLARRAVAKRSPLRRAVAKHFPKEARDCLASLAIQSRPGREETLWTFLREFAEPLVRGLEGRDEIVCERNSIFGAHDALLLSSKRPIRLSTLIVMVALLRHLTHVDTPMRSRIRHLFYRTHTTLGYVPATSTSRGQIANELAPLDDDAPSSTSAGPSRPRSLRAWLIQNLPIYLRQLQITATQRDVGASASWLPDHIHEAVLRLVHSFNAGLREPTTAIYLLDLLPSLRTLLQVIETGEMNITQHHEEVLVWQPIPSLHGGAGVSIELQERLVVPHLVNVLRMLDVGLRQRLRQRFSDAGDDSSIELAGGRHKWLSSVSTLVPALQEIMMPSPDVFRWPGMGLVGLTERSLEVLVPSFAFVQVDAHVLDRPEQLITLFQEIGHIALRAPTHKAGALSIREAAHALTRGAASAMSPLLRLLEEIYCDLVLLFQGFNADFRAYSRFVLEGMRRLLTRSSYRYRDEVYGRLFIVWCLLHPPALSTPIPSPGRVTPRLRESIESAVAEVYEAFASEVGARPEEFGATNRETLLANTVDTIIVLTPDRLRKFTIGSRSVESWFQFLARRAREADRASVPRSDPPTVTARNLHRRSLTRRNWPGIAFEPAELQLPLIATSAFPLVVPTDLSLWVEDARGLAVRSEAEVTDAERTALMHSLWTASQALRRLMIEKERNDRYGERRARASTTTAPVGMFLCDLFLLIPREDGQEGVAS